jgi:transcription elongation GreA/GreB family factor
MAGFGPWAKPGDGWKARAGKDGVKTFDGGRRAGLKARAGSGLLGRSSVNTSKVIEAIIAHLTGELALYIRAAQTARSEATDEQSKAENKYDTRGLEASYLARGQSRQAAELESAIEVFRSMTTGKFGPATPIDVGALVELEVRKARVFYFVGPSMGGTEVMVDGEEITVLTLASPLGQQLSGRKVGDRVKLPSGEASRIVSVA